MIRYLISQVHETFVLLTSGLHKDLVHIRLLPTPFAKLQLV